MSFVFSFGFLDFSVFQASLLAQDAAPADPPPLPSILSGMLPVFIGIFFLYYFIVVLPEKRSRVSDERLKSELKKNDRVVTIGGIHAMVAAVSEDSDVVTLKLDESGGTRMKVDRSAIRRVVTPKEDSDESKK